MIECIKIGKYENKAVGFIKTIGREITSFNVHLFN